MRSIEADKRTNSRNRKLGGPGAARKAVRVLSSLMTWAVGEGRLERNPIIGNLRLTGDNQRETIIGAPEEYVRLYAAMDDLVASGDLRPMVRAFIVVAALTGARRGELRGLRWGDVDLEARRVTLRGTKGSKLATKGPKLEFMGLPWRAVNALAAITRGCAAQRSRLRAGARQQDVGEPRLESDSRRCEATGRPHAARSAAFSRHCRRDRGP
jgi:integrase